MGAEEKRDLADEKRGSSGTKVALHISQCGTSKKREGLHHKNDHSQRNSKRRPAEQG